ncbi:hypothetical protein CFP59_08989 [Streptomyces malaysiensis subsp. malaysiensis]|nr:hypothetical protein CFP59_08989 [Streptomyces sp. M56]
MVTGKCWLRLCSWRRRAAHGSSCRPPRSGRRERQPTGASPSGQRHAPVYRIRACRPLPFHGPHVHRADRAAGPEQPAVGTEPIQSRVLALRPQPDPGLFRPAPRRAPHDLIGRLAVQEGEPGRDRLGVVTASPKLSTRAGTAAEIRVVAGCDDLRRLRGSGARPGMGRGSAALRMISFRVRRRRARAYARPAAGCASPVGACAHPAGACVRRRGTAACARPMGAWGGPHGCW